jgi:hypothetical protein
MKTEHTTEQRVDPVFELGGGIKEYAHTEPMKHTITIEFRDGEFIGDARWMWDLVLGLLNVITVLQKPDGLTFHPDMRARGLRYLKGLSPEAATLIGLIIDGRRET